MHQRKSDKRTPLEINCIPDRLSCDFTTKGQSQGCTTIAQVLNLFSKVASPLPGRWLRPLMVKSHDRYAIYFQRRIQRRTLVSSGCARRLSVQLYTRCTNGSKHIVGIQDMGFWGFPHPYMCRQTTTTKASILSNRFSNEWLLGHHK